jgi:uncharacterized protein (DUF362 family)
MSKKLGHAYTKFNLLREKSGLPTLSRRAFLRAVAMASAGAYVPFLSCTEAPPYDGSQAAGTLAPPQGGTTVELGGSGEGGSGGSIIGSGGKVPAGKGGAGGRRETGGTAGKAGTGAAGKPAIKPGSATVGITRNADTTAAVAAAIEAAGGLADIKQGQKVFIKPNISISSSGGFTSLPVMRGIVAAVATRTDPQNITIAECTSMGSSTLQAASAAGYLDLVQELGVSFLAFEDQDYKMFKDPKWTYLKTPKSVPISVHPETKIYDHFILAPVLKNHAMVNAWIPDCDVDFTCCMKLFIGILPYIGTGGRSDSADDPHNAKLGENVAELNCIVPKVTMCVVDATTIGIVGGPTPTRFAQPGLIIASKDRVACDSVAFATLKNYGKDTGQTYAKRGVWQQSQIKHGGELGLGIADPKKITIEPIDVDNFEEIKAQWV